MCTNPTRLVQFFTACFVLMLFHGPTVHAQTPPTTISENSVAVALDLGLSPEALVIAGIPNHAQTILLNVEAQSALCQQLDLLKQNLDAANIAVTEARQVVDADPTDPDAQQLYQQATQARMMAENDVINGRDYLYDLLTEGLPQDALAVLDQWQTNAHRRIPASFKVLNYNEDDWKIIERALWLEQKALRKQQAVPVEASSVLIPIRSHADVQVAQQRLDQSLTAVTVLYTSAGS